MKHEYIKLNECIICLESNDTDYSICKLNSFEKECECDSYIHKQCLLKWYTYNRSCPICKTNIHDEIITSENIIEDEETDHTILHIYYCNDCMNTILVKCFCYLVITIVIALGCNRDLFKNQTDN